MSGASNPNVAGPIPVSGSTAVAGPSAFHRRYGRVAMLVHQQPLLLLATAGICGILLDDALGTGFAVPIFWTCLFVSGLLIGFLGGPRIRLIAMAVCCLPVIAYRHSSSDRDFESATLRSVVGSVAGPAVIEGVIDRPVVLRRHPLADQIGRQNQSPWQSKLELTVDRLQVGYEFERFDGRVLVVGNGRLDHLRPGDSLRVYGLLQQFDGPTNPGERDLRAVYRRRNLHARVDVATADQVILLDRSIHPARTVASIAAQSRDLLLKHTGQTSGPLAVALVIGQRDFVDSETRDSLLVTGTVHLLSVSGLHLAIMVVLANWIATLFRMPQGGRIAWIIVICVLYTAITGSRPPVMRAAVLVGTLMVAIWLKRPGQPVNTLSLAALMLMFINPEFVFSVGVQLSFLAVATLLMCGRRGGESLPSAAQAVARERRLESLIEGSRSPVVRHARWLIQRIAQLIRFSACVTAITTPLVWHQFHVVSPISVVANVCLGPLLFVSLAAGVMTVVGGWILDPLAIAPGWICDLSVRLMKGVIDGAAACPGGHFWLPSPPTWWVIVFYLVIAASLWWPRASKARCLWITLWILVAWVLATRPAPLPDGTIEATFVDVGHGTSVVLRFSDNDVWMYDCGRLGNDTGSSRDIDATLWSMGVTGLNGVLLSHADSDHYNALPGILRRFRVRQIITPPGMLDEPEGALVSARAAVDAAGVEVREVSRGRRIATDHVTLQVLHPPPQRLRGSDNANSLVLQIEHCGKTLLLPGDLEPPGTEILINQPRPAPGGILMAPHHGSLRMDAESVLQWSRPAETVVSGGSRARRAEVQEMLTITGSGVHVTANAGAVRVRINAGGQLEVRSWRDSPW